MANNSDIKGALKAIANGSDVVYDMSTMEDKIVIALDIQQMVENIMKYVETIETIDAYVPIVIQVGGKQILLKRETEVVKTIKTKGYNIVKG